MKFVKPAALIALLLIASVPSFAQKLKPEEIIAKHLDSIGTADARAAAASRMVVGEVIITFVTKKNQLTQGRVVMASEGKKGLIGMTLNAHDYTNEKFVSDGNKASVGFAYMSRRSPLGDFVAANDMMLSHGLLGGTLSTAWPLLNAAGAKGKFSGGSIKKIDGKEVYTLSYSAKGGGADVTLYFDKETFRHVRTEYKTVQSAGIGRTPEQSSGYDETRVKLVEDFSDFRDEKGLMMPHSYKISYSNSGQGGTSELEWAIILSAFTPNPKLEANTFDQ
jgi:hypothetical protein